jgi:hypothetical protein
VVDLDFELHKLTIGVLLSYDVDEGKSLLSLRLPVGARFNFKKAEDWELDVGTIQNPASALVLNIVRASGYLMFAGDGIPDFPHPPGPEGGLKHFAIALGVRAALTLGDEAIGLYLKVSARLDAAVVFSPFHIYGLLELTGQLHLFIISLSASATLLVDAPDPTIVKGEVCASLDLWLFTISGCIELKIPAGEPEPAVLQPPPLVEGLALQSRSPALAQGQGSDAPIDGKLDDAVEVTAVSADKSDPALKDLQRVPIDVVPVLKLHAAPNHKDDDGKACQTFTRPLRLPRRHLPGGWMDQGGGRSVRYVLKSLQLDPPLPPPGPGQPGKPPATWRADSPRPNGQDTAVDLALFSWEPVSDARAYQRSADLTDRIAARWSGLCQTVAAPAAVLWTFNRQALGPAGEWRPLGAALPDPPDTRRSAPADTDVVVRGPEYDPVEAALQADAFAGNPEPARVVGFDARPGAEGGNNVPPTVAGRALQLPFIYPREAPPVPPPPPKVIADGDFGSPASGQPEAHGNGNGNGNGVDAAPAAPAALAAPSPGAVLDRPAAPLQSLAAPAPESVSVECGPFELGRLLLAFQQNLDASKIVLRAFDGAGTLLRSDAISALPTEIVFGLGDLPADWLFTGPVAQDVTQVVELLQQFRYQPHIGFTKRLVTYAPPAGTVRFELAVIGRPVGRQLDNPLVLLGALELLRAGEVARAVHDEEARSEEIATVEEALATDRPRPLLAPDTRYTVSLTYDAQVRQPDPDAPGGFKVTTFSPPAQRYSFITDAAPPARLNPWVLATTPAAEEPAHFVDDPLRIIFNDRSAVQLFTAYGKPLRVVVRQANGNHPQNKPPIVDDEASLKPLKARILTPFEEGLRVLLRDSEELGCVQIPESESHRLTKVDVALEPGTAYTLDVEPADLPPYPTDPKAPPRAPLYRTAFTTSRYRSAAELAATMRTAKVQHRVLSRAIGALSSTPTDNELENALVAAGLEALPATGQPSVTLLWQPAGSAGPAGADFVLAAALLDAPEALWRSRPEPVLLTETGEGGPMKHYVDLPRPWLEVVEAGTGAVTQFIRSSGGTRGLFLLRPGAAALSLALRQYEHSLIDPTAFADAPLFSAPLPPVAPWRTDDD